MLLVRRTSSAFRTSLVCLPLYYKKGWRHIEGALGTLSTSYFCTVDMGLSGWSTNSDTSSRSSAALGFVVVINVDFGGKFATTAISCSISINNNLVAPCRQLNQFKFSESEFDQPSVRIDIASFARVYWNDDAEQGFILRIYVCCLLHRIHFCIRM